MPNQRNLELEAAILTNLSAEEGFLVYGDWLQASGDPRGELVAVQAMLASGADDDALRSRKRSLLAKIYESDFGAAAERLADDPGAIIRAAYRLGFPDEVSIGLRNWSGFEDANGLDLERIATELLRGPGGAFLRTLRIGPPTPDGVDFAGMVSAIVRAGPHTALRTLVIGDFELPEHAGISWAIIGGLGKLWAAFPMLERLEVQGAEIRLGQIEAPTLRHLELRSGGLPRGALMGITSGNLPALETLLVWTGAQRYGATSACRCRAHPRRWQSPVARGVLTDGPANGSARRARVRKRDGP